MSTFSEWLKKTFQPKPGTCSTDPGTDALLSVIRLVARVSKGTLAVIAGGGISPIAALIAIGSLVPDLVHVIVEHNDIPCELMALNGESYELLMKAIIFEFGLDSDHAKTVLDTSVSILGDIVKMGPDVRKILAEMHDMVK